MSEQQLRCEDLIQSRLDSRLSDFDDPTTIAECRAIVSDHGEYDGFTDKPEGFDESDISSLMEIAEDHVYDDTLRDIHESTGRTVQSVFDELVDDGSIDILDDCIEYATNCRRESMSEGVLSVERVIRFTDSDGNDKSENIDWEDSEEVSEWEHDNMVITDCECCSVCEDDDDDSNCEDADVDYPEFERVIRVMLSWGGPSDGYDFFINSDGSVRKVVYFYQDWFDGARLDVPSGFEDQLAQAYSIENGVSHGL